MTRSRREFARSLGLAALVVLPTYSTAWAQDPRASVVASAAREWLEMTDKDDAAGSHASAGAKFRKALGVSQWKAALAKERAPRGALVQRTTMQTTFDPKFDKAPPGDYAMLQFRTAFANQSVAQETLTLEREPDSRWRVIGYFVR